MEPLYGSIIGVARGLFKVQGLRFDISGSSYIPAEGGAVLVMNHTGYLDFIFLGVPARLYRRFVRFMAKKEVFENAVSGPLMRGMHHIAVDRAAGEQAYSEAVAALRAGELVGVFPEATISQSFELKDFKTGCVRMAKEAGVPLVPVVCWGSQRVWTKGGKKNLGYRKFPIHMRVLPPVKLTDDIDADIAGIRARMAETLLQLQDEYAQAHGEYPHGASWVPARLGGSAPTLQQANEADAQAKARRSA